MKLLEVNLNDVAARVKREEANLQTITEMSAASAIAKTRAFALLIHKEHIAIFFADIMDKGVTQGLYMMKAKNMLKKALLKHPPEKALHTVNEELFNSREKNIPLKVFLGILNLRSGVLLTFNSGHVNPIIKSKNGNTSFISGPFNPLLGASYDSEFIPLPLQLNAGDNFYFYSNDMIEIQNAGGEKYGRERLRSVIYSSGNNAAETIQSVRQAVMDFGGETSHEADIAIAVLEYTPESTERQTL